MVVDASVWISAFVRQDVNHAASRRWLAQRTTVSEDLIAPVILLVEVGGGVSRRTGRPSLARRAVRELLNAGKLRLIPLDRRLAQSAALLAVDLRLRGADSLYVATARQFAIPLVTWDREQRDRAAAVVAAFEPAAR